MVTGSRITSPAEWGGKCISQDTRGCHCELGTIVVSSINAFHVLLAEAQLVLLKMKTNPRLEMNGVLKGLSNQPHCQKWQAAQKCSCSVLSPVPVGSLQPGLGRVSSHSRKTDFFYHFLPSSSTDSANEVPLYMWVWPCFLS